MGDGETFFVVVYFYVPNDVAGLGVEGDQVCIEGGHVETVAEDGEAAIGHDGAVAGDFGKLTGVVPETAAGFGVEGGGVVEWASYEHHAVDNYGRCFYCVAAELVGEGAFELGGVGWGDLFEARVVTTFEATPVGEPVLGFCGGVLEPIEGYVEVWGGLPIGGWIVGCRCVDEEGCDVVAIFGGDVGMRDFELADWICEVALVEEVPPLLAIHHLQGEGVFAFGYSTVACGFDHWDGGCHFGCESGSLVASSRVCEVWAEDAASPGEHMTCGTIG